ncbi:MAG: caspase family protein [Rhodospirillaceae bacterium]|nr:caspase family protein [Rhodospirillaceae bacterium]MBT5195267.1 caspase family protein [Rhodospirillaceae bacterium]MBT5895151.1 caspase family protein [Rhodospirillaceae bacterium]
MIIGNRAYSDRIPTVEFAHNDAKAMRDYVTEVLGYRPGNIIDLRDASLADLRKVFGDGNSHKGQLFNYTRPGKSDVFVFYSGHGVPGLRDRRGYLLPKDGDANLAEFTGYPLDTLYANLRKIPARSVTVVIDACFSGESPKGMLVAATSGLTVTAKPTNTKGLTLLTAAQGDQVASWDEEAKQGLFTKHFLEGVYGAADGNEFGNGDGKVTLAELRGYLNEEMSYRARRRFGREQIPTVQGEDELVLAALTSLPAKRKIAQEPPAAIDTQRFDGLWTANMNGCGLSSYGEPVSYDFELEVASSKYSLVVTATPKFGDDPETHDIKGLVGADGQINKLVPFRTLLLDNSNLKVALASVEDQAWLSFNGCRVALKKRKFEN